MFARSALRLSKGSLTKSAAFTHAFPGAAFRTLARLGEADSSVMAYSCGEQKEEIIRCDLATTGPVNPPGADEEIRAMPLDKELIPRLSPTLRRFTLSEKVAVVTGHVISLHLGAPIADRFCRGGRGLGYNMAQALAEVGIRGLAIMDVQQEAGEQASRALAKQTGIDVRFYDVDVRDSAAVHQTVQDVSQQLGQIDVLINAAGIADSNMKAETYDLTKFRRLIDINVTGSFIVAQAVAKHMISASNPGSIINVASMSGSIVNFPQEQSCYNASKAAVIQLTRSLAAEWARFNIRVNAISPGYMDTALNRVPALDAQKRIWIDLTPQKRLGAVDELNNLAVYLASEGSGFMTGNNCLIDGGYTCW